MTDVDALRLQLKAYTASLEHAKTPMLQSVAAIGLPGVTSILKKFSEGHRMTETERALIQQLAGCCAIAVAVELCEQALRTAERSQN